MVREHVAANDTLGSAVLTPSPSASQRQLLRVHSPNYVAAALDGTLSQQEPRRIGLPWSTTLAHRSQATVGGSLAAAQEALQHGISGQLAGGTHHAHREFGSGFCLFNDLAVAAADLLHEGRVERVAILDLDVHQGDGNATILSPNPAVFVASVHGEKNFPFEKATSDLDIALGDNADDVTYLEAVGNAIDAALAFRPDIVLYLAGVDPLDADRLGRLSVSGAGLVRRDALVLDACKRHRVPVSIVAGGGYAEPITLTVAAYVATWSTVRSVYAL